GPEIQALLALHPHHNITQHNGQRIYSRYSPLTPPAPGCELFIRGLPSDYYEDELVPALEQVGAGPVVTLRLMVNFSGRCRGYAFAEYSNPWAARVAINLLDNRPIKRSSGTPISVRLSHDIRTLSVGNVPNDCPLRELAIGLSTATDGVVTVRDVVTGVERSRQLVVEYRSHYSAAMARRVLAQGLYVGANRLTFEWLTPGDTGDACDEIRTLCVRRLDLRSGRQLLADLFAFNGALRVDGVRIVRNYLAFVRFRTRLEAQMAMEWTAPVAHSYKFDVSWAMY
ncbi:unnamed protein product, partial [Medioppia subpectinata]